MQITNRDLELLRKLSKYGMLSTQQIAKMTFQQIALTTVLRRLRLLEDHKLIQRTATLPTHEVLWSLTDRGAGKASVTVPKRNWSKNLLDHDYKLLSLRLLLEGNGIARSWTPEHEIRSIAFKKYSIRGMKDRVIPDALIGVTVKGKMESVAVELELTLKNVTKLKKVIRHYRESDGLYGVWYIVPRKSMTDQIHRVWNDCRIFAKGTRIFYSYLDEVINAPATASLISIEPMRKIIEVFTPLPAQVGAHRMSTLDEKKNESKTELTEENHAPILSNAS